MKLIVSDRLLQIYDVLPPEFTMKDVVKLLEGLEGANANYHTVRFQLLKLVEHGALHKARTHYHKNFRTITRWFKMYVQNPEKVKSLG